MFRSLMTVCLAAVIACSSAFAQTATGTITGRVADASGALITGASVLIENENTGIAQTVTTGESGRFIQPYLIPGQYRVTIEKPGFQKSVTSNIGVAVQQTVDLDLALKVGEISTVVEVEASAAQLQTSTSATSTVITSKAMLDLPLLNRNPFDLARLIPGVIPSGGGSTPFISGGRNSTSEITIDGTSVIVPENNVGIQDTGYTPIVDTVQEFAVITNSMAAELGRSGGGFITVATRSGTNQVHGSLFEFFRNGKLNANTWANNRNNQPRQQVQRNQFGGTIGGPIVLPKLYDGRNKSFFFFAHQSTYQRQAESTTQTVPLPEWLNGDFSNFRNGNGQLITIYDPLTVTEESPGVFVRQPFPNNIIPADRIDPVARRVAQFFPKPNATPNNAFAQTNNFFAAGKSQNDERKYDARLDHNFSEAWKLWGRFSYSNNPDTPFNGFGNLGTSSGSGPSDNRNTNLALNAVHTFSPTTILNLNAGVARKFVERTPFSNGIDLTTLGFSSAYNAQAAQQNQEFPRFNFGGNNGVTALGQGTFTTLNIYSTAYNTRADVTKILSNHTFKGGVEWRKFLLNFTQHGQPSGEFNFNNNAFTQRVLGAANSTTQGSGLAAFLLGLPNGGQTSHTFDIATESSYWGFYFQDDWRVSSKLTLNIGLRWDVDIPRTERYNRLSYFDIDAPSPIAGLVPGFPNLKGAMRFVTPENRRQAPTDKNNWGPRFGFAYQLTEKTVFRGAYGMMYSGSALQASGSSGSSGTQGFQNNTPVSATFNNGRTFIASLSNPFPTGYEFPLGTAESRISGAATQLGLDIGDSYFNDYQNPVIQQWNANLQRDLGLGFVVEAGYLGSKGQHLIDGESNMAYNQLPASYGVLGNQLLDSNQVPNPFFGVITNPRSPYSQQTIALRRLLTPYPQYQGINAFRKPQGNSLYHAFTLGVTKRYSHGLNMQLSYTASKLIDDTSTSVNFQGATGSKQDFYNRRGDRSVASQDVPQRFVISSNYELPFGKGRAFMTEAPKVVDFLLGGWQVNGIGTWQKGLPIAITQGNGTNLGSPGQRPSTNGKNPEKTGPIHERLTSYFDQTAFFQTPNFQFGNLGRFLPNVRGPSRYDFDGSIFKNFVIREGIRTEFRMEAYNAMNHPLWNGPGTDITNPATFGIVQTKNNDRRQIQLALKLMF